MDRVSQFYITSCHQRLPLLLIINYRKFLFYMGGVWYLPNTRYSLTSRPVLKANCVFDSSHITCGRDSFLMCFTLPWRQNLQFQYNPEPVRGCINGCRSKDNIIHSNNTWRCWKIVKSGFHICSSCDVPLTYLKYRTSPRAWNNL